MKTIGNFTLFRTHQDLVDYFAELNTGGDSPVGEPYSPPFHRPDFPFWGRQILDDDLFPVDFITIGGDEAFAMAVETDATVTRS